MLKSSSLCLYSSNLGTFRLKIEQFSPFEEISILSNGGHLGYRTSLTDTILKEDRLRIISAKFGWDWPSSFRGEDYFFNFIPPFFLICIIGQNRQKFKVHKKSRNNVKRLIIMLIQFKFGHILAWNRAVLAIWRNFYF